MVAEAVPASGTPRTPASPKKEQKGDVLDAPDFNVTHYINEMFPTGAVLKVLSVIQKLW